MRRGAWGGRILACNKEMMPMGFVRTVETAAARLGAAMFAAAGVFISYEVVARYFFNAPTIWAAEISQLCLIWGSLLSMAWVLTERRHIRVTAVTDLLPDKVRAWLEVISTLVVAGFSAVVLWHGFAIFQHSLMRGRTSGTMLDMPMWIVEASVPLGFALLLVATVNALRKALAGDVPRDMGHVE
jgi:TRAP-type C4-dicarboxylate transport system permease small subunit